MRSSRTPTVSPAQAEAMKAAYEMGYFEVPRGASSETVAAELGVSKSAFLERLRRGERALLRHILD